MAGWQNGTGWVKSGLKRFINNIIKNYNMKSVFLLIGDKFTDDTINKFAEALTDTMPVELVWQALDWVDSISGSEEQGNIFYLETNICKMNKSYIDIYCQIIKGIKYKPSAVYLLPHAPKKIVNYIRSFWACEIYVFPYDQMKPAYLLDN